LVDGRAWLTLKTSASAIPTVDLMEKQGVLRFKMLVIVAGVAAAGVPTRASGGNVEIAEQIVEQINTYIRENDIHDFAIHVRVKDGMATVTGHVRSQEQAAVFVQIARRHPEIREVRNDLKIQPEPTPPLLPPLPAGGPDRFAIGAPRGTDAVRLTLSMPVDVDGEDGRAVYACGRAAWVGVRWGAGRRAAAAHASRIRGAFGLMRPMMRRDAASTLGCQ
jgi:hypothetical protein